MAGKKNLNEDSVAQCSIERTLSELTGKIAQIMVTYINQTSFRDRSKSKKTKKKSNIFTMSKKHSKGL